MHVIKWAIHLKNQNKNRSLTTVIALQLICVKFNLNKITIHNNKKKKTKNNSEWS